MLELNFEKLTKFIKIIYNKIYNTFHLDKNNRD